MTDDNPLEVAALKVDGDAGTEPAATHPVAKATVDDTEKQGAAAEVRAETAVAPAEADAGEAEAANDAEASSEEAGPDPKTASSEANEDEKRRGFLSAFFSPSSRQTNAATRALAQTAGRRQGSGTPSRGGTPTAAATKDDAKGEPAATRKDEPDDKPLVTLASTAPARGSILGEDALPGVRGNSSLFEISSKSGTDDVDVYEDVGSYQVASAAGMARISANGLAVQRDSVDVSCLKPSLVRVLKTIERHYGRRLVVTSGYRSPAHNRRVNGARHSQHLRCAAADIQVGGISKWELAKYVRAMPGRGGVGTYCHTNSIHVDVGPQRDWNWRCGHRR